MFIAFSSVHSLFIPPRVVGAFVPSRLQPLSSFIRAALFILAGCLTLCYPLCRRLSPSEEAILLELSPRQAIRTLSLSRWTAIVCPISFLQALFSMGTPFFTSYPRGGAFFIPPQVFFLHCLVCFILLTYILDK
jgi:hypothetical protein